LGSRQVTRAVRNAEKRARAAQTEYKSVEEGAKKIAKDTGITEAEAQRLIIEELEKDEETTVAEATERAGEEAEEESTESSEGDKGEEGSTQESEPDKSESSEEPKPEVKPELEHFYHRRLWGRNKASA
jgi:hypothetical protein